MGKEKLIHLLSTTWFTLPVRKMEDRDQRHKGREVFWGLLLAGINLLGTFSVLCWLKELRIFALQLGLLILGPLIFFHLCGSGLLFLFEKAAHPWRHLGKGKE